jgi:hypothetical protein
MQSPNSSASLLQTGAFFRIVQWLAVLTSAALTLLFLLGLGLVGSEYRPSGAILLQQVLIAFGCSLLATCIAIYLMRRPPRGVALTSIAYLSLFISIGSVLAMYLIESWVWDAPSMIRAWVAVLATTVSGCTSLISSWRRSVQPTDVPAA